MTIVSIVASGSRGDVQPYLALGKGLKDAGYDVRLLSSDNFASLVTEFGLTFVSVGFSVEERLQSEEWMKVIEGGNFLSILARMRSEMKTIAEDQAKRMPDLLAGSDMIITGLGGLAGIHAIADRLNVPMIEAYVVPFTPTDEFSSPLVPKLPFGKTLNRISFHITRQMFWQSFKSFDVTTRQRLGMAKGNFWGPFRSMAQRQRPTLYGYSPHVLPRPHDWAQHYHVTGYWFLDEPEGWTPPADLVEFLDAGEPPVYIGFGSMKSQNPKAAGQIALEALARSGQRGVIASGWGGLELSDLPETVHTIASIPHSWLFPRMAAVVHHGGAGTTAAGLRAGVPSIIAPFMGDQPFWGQRVADLGVGTQPIPKKRLTGKRLAGAITEAISNKSMRQKASELGRAIRNEDGVASAVRILERFMQPLKTVTI